MAAGSGPEGTPQKLFEIANPRYVPYEPGKGAVVIDPYPSEDDSVQQGWLGVVGAGCLALGCSFALRSFTEVSDKLNKEGMACARPVIQNEVDFPKHMPGQIVFGQTMFAFRPPFLVNGVLEDLLDPAQEWGRTPKLVAKPGTDIEAVLKEKAPCMKAQQQG
ncbi:hypothetical protein M1523_01230 [Patescibacteria group bacterium]|nr:hypothetical protein [Patescibacteria group bacterium]MCL5091195.1 hypothetical protein [Patescibacteria group bacterium]